MSPTEDDLRAALRRGEGDAPDAGRLIARAEAVRGHRRAQLRSGVLGVVVVAAVGGGGAALLSAGRGDDAQSGAKGSAPSRVTAGAAGSSAAASTAAAAGGAARPPTQGGRGPAACPASAPHYLLPGGGGSGQFGADGPLFAAPVASLRICGYPAAAGTGTSPAVRQLVITGARAQQVVDSAEKASRRPLPSSCPAVPGGAAAGRAPVLALIGVTADGRQLRPVTVTLACAGQTTNGTAVRYGWTPPADVLGVLPAGTSAAASQAHGSPIRS